MRLIVEQQVVHGPELALARCSFSRERGHQGMRMDFLQGEVPVSNADAADEAFEQHLHCRGSLPAARAFEIAVLDNGQGRMLGAEQVIGVAHGDGELKARVMIHWRYWSAVWIMMPDFTASVTGVRSHISASVLRCSSVSGMEIETARSM